MKALTLPAGRGWHWLSGGFRLFRKGRLVLSLAVLGYWLIAGQGQPAVGPTPSVPDPGFLSDDVAMNFVLTAGGGNHIATFTTSTGAGSVGDNIGMLTAEAIKLNAIPTNGAAFTIACDGANCGTASGTLINIITTDAATTGLPPFARLFGPMIGTGLGAMDRYLPGITEVVAGRAPTEALAAVETPLAAPAPTP